MLVRLFSDFDDYYDSMFDREGLEFRRVSTEGMTRAEMLGFLDHHGFVTPPHGTVKEVIDKFRLKSLEDGGWGSDTFRRILEHKLELVVYLNDAHNGEGKVKIPALHALENYPGFYCTEFVTPQRPNRAVSFRHLYIGKRNWLVRYANGSGWRSNRGRELQIEVLGEGAPGYHPQIINPIFAIDYVPDENGRRLAVDYNTAPRLELLTDYLEPCEVVELIKSAMGRGAGKKAA
jgi:hypothetical protein